MRRFPMTLDTDTTEVRDALEIARTQYTRGHLDDAMRWLHRAADIAFEQSRDDRGLLLSKAAAELGPPRPPATPPAARPVENVRPRPAEPLPVNRAPAPERPEPTPQKPPPRAPAPTMKSAPPVPISSAARARVMDRPSSPATTSSPPRASVPPRPVPIPQRDSDEPTDAFRLPPSDPSLSDPIPLTARKVEPFDLDDDVTHVGAAPAGLIAALAAERPKATSSAKPDAPRALPRALSERNPAAKPLAPQPDTKKPPPQRPSQTQPVAQPATSKPAPQPAVALRSDDEDDRTSPSMSPGAMQAMVAAVKERPAVHAAMRVALSRGPQGVSARAIGRDGLRAGEVEVMVVGLAPDADLGALFSG